MGIVKNRKGQKQPMSEMAYNKLGRPDAEGYRDGWKWLNDDEQTVSNVQLPTGEKSKPAKKNPPVTQTVSNTINNDEHSEASKTEPATDSQEITQQQKDEFMAAIDGISPAAIKEYFDRPEVNVKYDKKAKPMKLVLQFAEHIKYDINAFQKAFE